MSDVNYLNQTASVKIHKISHLNLSFESVKCYKFHLPIH